MLIVALGVVLSRRAEDIQHLHRSSRHLPGVHDIGGNDEGVARLADLLLPPNPETPLSLQHQSRLFVRVAVFGYDTILGER